MDLKETMEEKKFRDELASWLKANVPPPLETDSADVKKANDQTRAYGRAWQRKLFDAGWAGISWPKEYGGRDAKPIENSIFSEEYAKVNAPGRITTIGESLVGPTIIKSGTDEQKKKFLPAILNGDDIWCQGFSEPNAGSDLASLATKCVEDKDHYVVNGQKIWTSYAHLANRIMLLVRTDTSVKKHKGITCLLVDMEDPAIEVRPLRQISGDSGFNEVFFSNLRVPKERMLGDLNNGWYVAITALSNERANLGTGAYVGFKNSIDSLIEKANTRSRNGKKLGEDPIVRQKIAQLATEVEVFRLNMTRTLSKIIKGDTPGPEGSILKLYWSEMNQRIAQQSMEILGEYSQLEKSEAGRWSYNYLRSRGNTIEAGTSEVQRNIIAQRVLGLPRSY